MVRIMDEVLSLCYLYHSKIIIFASYSGKDENLLKGMEDSSIAF